MKFDLKCPYVDDTIKGGPMMWVSFAMDGNRQEGKWLVVEHKALKWVKANNAPPKGSPWWVPMADGWLWHQFHNYDVYKIEETWMHIMHEQRGWVVWCPHLLHKVFEIRPFLTLNWKRLPHLAKK
jgi:hypothetical protein